jgi:nicotinamidase-related amidase
VRQEDQGPFTRIRPFDARRTCLLLIDVQNYVWNPDVAKRLPSFDSQVRDVVLPNLRRLIDAFRRAGAEVMYTVIENLTNDGRDRSLDYKLSDFFVGKSSWEAKVLGIVAPADDDIVLAKTSSSVFNSTNIEYLLRNMGVETLVVTGFLTDQCVDHTVRDAADRGFYPICIADACASHSQTRHDNALKAFSGYCRTMTSVEILAEIDR